MSNDESASDVIAHTNEEDGPNEHSHRRTVPIPSRPVIALAGLACVALAELVPPGALQSTLADIGFLGLVIAAISLLTTTSSLPSRTLDAALGQPSYIWRWTIAGLGITGSLLIQFWFRSGTVLAGGDIAPPVGAAWIGRIFSTYGWNGTTLGGPVQNQINLPWAAVEWVTQQLGGSGALAQRIWLSLLVSAVLMTAASLARALKFSPLSGAVVSLAYFLNPMTMSQVGVNAVYLTAMFLIPLLAAAALSYGNNRIRLWQLCAVFVVAAPFVGYADANPPLVGLLVATTFFSVLLSWAKFGRESATRSLRGLIIAGLFLVLVSSYWLIPAILSLGAVSSGNLTPLSSWAFTEIRATLTNGFWLNNYWGWNPLTYVPFAAYYSRFPFDLVPPLIPLVAFSGLARLKSYFDTSNERLKGLLALSSLGVVLFSTGTNWPGRWLFDPLYKLPYGWLLREPGRFLMIAALGYALLAGLLVEQSQIIHRSSDIHVRRSFSANRERLFNPTWVAVVLVVVTLAGSFPIWIGLLIPGPHQGFPSNRVAIPTYWTSMGNYLNSSISPRGPLLVLPPDDFYQMPYTWYYGNDGFIVDLLSRHTLDPSSQGYEGSFSSLTNAVELESSALLEHRWVEAGKILNALGTPVMLVRGDIERNFAGRSIVSPTALATALGIDPEILGSKRIGPLSLFVLKAKYHEPWNDFVTVNSSSPNLDDLSLVPRRFALITSAPLRGKISLHELPPLATWSFSGNALSTQISLPTGWRYRLASTNGAPVTTTKFSVKRSSRNEVLVARAQVQMSGQLISNGQFLHGTWGPVRNCNAMQSIKAPNYLRAAVIPHVAPGGLPALQLSSSIDAPCETTVLAWRAGPILISLWARSVSGASPSICLWQQPLNSCASVPPIQVRKENWQHYSVIVNPSAGTRSITLFLEDYTYQAGIATDQFANIQVRRLVSNPTLVVIGTPLTKPKSGRIVSFPNSYSSRWHGPPRTKHVIVNGLTNGLIIPTLTSKKTTKTRNSR